ncbi:leucine-rich repeat domain-containing protein [Dictyobacter arantiisoli]|uniref:Uncharacterized protein n=1 Tax=Dictyobacter arantiisoli TaxID=2014874 RepID=A0A5A5TJR8_9CHLR|nr:leucine-rich repeat domain-containing protein [Dictyobacter arantiisoli]GCF11850.1 hypothetical protein KDI_54140 [Dictyobacter arantiisoli]
MDFATLIQHVSDPQWQTTLLATLPQLSLQEGEHIIKQLLQDGDQNAQQRIRLHMLAAACLDILTPTTPTSTSIVPGSQTTRSVQTRLKKLLPPKTVKAADELAAQAGKLAIKPLSDHLNVAAAHWGSQRTNSLRALARIPDQSALQALHSYLQNTSTLPAIEEGLKLWKLAADPDGYAQQVLAPLFLKHSETHLRLYRVEELTGLQHLTMLESLELDQCTTLQDLSPLAALTQLEVLDLNACGRITSLAPLRELSRLRQIILPGCSNLRDLSGLINKPALTELNLHGLNHLRTIAPLSGLPGLKRLIISYADALTDISGLSALQEVEYLEIRNCGKLSDITPLAQLKRVREINLFACPAIQDLNPLTEMESIETIESNTGLPEHIGPWSQLQKLRHLKLRTNNRLTNLQELGRIPSLEELELGGCTHLQSFNGIEQATNLKRFAFYTQAVEDCVTPEDLTPLRGLPELQVLMLIGVNCPNLRGLTDLPRLENLTIQADHRLASLEGISNLPALRSLRLFDCPIEDISAITRLDSLTCFELALTTHVCDLTPLLALSKLEELSLIRNAGRQNLNGLKGQTTLRKLIVHGCHELQDVSALAGLPALTELSLSQNEQLDWSGVANLPNLTSLHLVHTTPTSFRSLQNVPMLKSITIEHSKQLVSLHGLENAQRLEQILCTWCDNLQDITALSTLTRLHTIKLSGMLQLTNITPLSGLHNLETLDLSYSGVSDLTPVEQLTKLRKLALNSSQTNSLSPLTQLSLLNELNITNMCAYIYIQDLTPLLHLPALHKIKIGAIYLNKPLPGLKELQARVDLEIDTSR